MSMTASRTGNRLITTMLSPTTDAAVITMAPARGSCEAPYSVGKKKKICAATEASAVSRSTPTMAATAASGPNAQATSEGVRRERAIQQAATTRPAATRVSGRLDRRRVAAARLDGQEDDGDQSSDASQRHQGPDRSRATARLHPHQQAHVTRPPDRASRRAARQLRVVPGAGCGGDHGYPGRDARPAHPRSGP